MVELLQRATIHLRQSESQAPTEDIVLQNQSPHDDQDAAEVDTPNDNHQHPPSHAPSLHFLAALYLPAAPLRMLFVGCALVHFTSLLIGYALAWSKAFCQVGGVFCDV